MCQMLLSINPEFVTSILQGKKLYEYRKFRCRDDVDKIIIYATAPQKQVVGEAEIASILEDDLLTVWHQTKKYSGITYKFFRKYYKGKKVAVAYQLKNLIIYDKPLALEDIGVSCAPQSYRYISTAV
ncbi:MAG: ASCH domain-containing protein [Clostridium sp.]|nr:ASCH domain-containing protein [Acetatifactor muris]MCM1527772.1 ASCH domain-containing protein [Bacteroides sp.]MCM1563867.1 ASCH domain-containing protein [Clostridium sp.]